MIIIVWFWQDLCLLDNFVFFEVVVCGLVLLVFVFEDYQDIGDYVLLGGVSCWWLYYSFVRLKEVLLGFVILCGDVWLVILCLVVEIDVSVVFWNCCYEFYVIVWDIDIKIVLKVVGIDVQSYKVGLLFEFWDLKMKLGGFFKVYLLFWKVVCQKLVDQFFVVFELILIMLLYYGGVFLEVLNLLLEWLNWVVGWSDIWQLGEIGVRVCFEMFLNYGFVGYGELCNWFDFENVL